MFARHFELKYVTKYNEFYFHLYIEPILYNISDLRDIQCKLLTEKLISKLIVLIVCNDLPALLFILTLRQNVFGKFSDKIYCPIKALHYIIGHKKGNHLIFV